jgi:hypothetical protein
MSKREHGPNAANHRKRLLVAFLGGDLTDDQAAKRCGLFKITGCCWWTRCSELRKFGLIEWVTCDGKRVTRMGSVGTRRGVSLLTKEGLKLAIAFKQNPNLPWPRF